MKILLATDGTKHSDSAISTLNNFKFADDDEIKIVSILDMAMPLSIDIYAGYLPSTTEIENTARENAQRVLEKTSRHVKELIGNENVFVTTDVLLGSPERRIVETAEEMRADLIIVGSHGYNRWERLLLGSVSDSVVHHAPCSVLVVRSLKEK